MGNIGRWDGWEKDRFSKESWAGRPTLERIKNWVFSQVGRGSRTFKWLVTGNDKVINGL